MKTLSLALAMAGFVLLSARAQEGSDPSAPATNGVFNAPKMNEAVDLTGTAPAESMEIPAPPGTADPDKSPEINEPLPDEEQAPPAVPVTGKIELTADDGGKTVPAAVGNLVSITLQSNPSTGYNWELRDFDYGVADFYKSETVAADRGNVLFGAPSKTVVTLQAVKPGTQDIKLVYRRLWEPPDQVAQTFEFRLAVEGEASPTTQASPSPATAPAR